MSETTGAERYARAKRLADRAWQWRLDAWIAGRAPFAMAYVDIMRRCLIRELSR